MSKLKCICGNGMSNSDAPSKNILKVFRKSHVKTALKKKPDITLFNFETSDSDGFEYWYCPNCKRVHVVENIPNGTVVKRYQVSSMKENVILGDLGAVYVFTATEIYDAEEDNFDTTLAEFIDQKGDSHLYFVNEAEDKIYKKNCESKGSLAYQKE